MEGEGQNSWPSQCPPVSVALELVYWFPIAVLPVTPSLGANPPKRTLFHICRPEF